MSSDSEKPDNENQGWERLFLTYGGGVVLLVLVVIILAIALSTSIDAWQAYWDLADDDMASHAQNRLEGYRNLMLGLGAIGAATIGVSLATWRGWALHTQAKSSLLNSQTALKNTEITEKGQMAEAFAKAIEQLGHDEMSIRIGGILALEKIAKTDPKGYHYQVFETLCAYVQGKAKSDHLNADTAIPFVDANDLKLVLRVLSRRKNVQIEQEYPLEMRFVDFRGSRISELNINNIDISFGYFEGQYLNGLDFRGLTGDFLNFDKTNMVGCQFENCTLFGARFVDAKFKSNNFKNANLDSAFFSNTKFDKTSDFRGADLSQAKFLPKAMRDGPNACLWDQSTKWPEKFAEDEEPPSRGMGEAESPP